MPSGTPATGLAPLPSYPLTPGLARHALYEEAPNEPRRGFFPRTIAGRIIASLLGVYLVTYLATAAVVYTGVRSAMIDANRNALDQLADIKYERLNNTIEQIGRNVSAWSELEIMNDLISDDADQRVQRMLEQLRRLYDAPGDIYAFSASGRLIASSRPNDPKRHTADLPEMWQVTGRKVVFFDKHTNPFGNDQIVAVAAPVYGSFIKDFHIGTLVLTYQWSAIERQIFSLDTSTVLLSLEDGAGRVLAADPPGTADRAGFGPLGRDAKSLTGFVAGRSIQRNSVLAPWQVVTLQETAAVTRSLRRVAMELLILGIVLGMPIALLIRWLTTRLTAPVVELTRVARMITDTDRLSARVRVTSTDELGTLARAFNRMTERLERASGERERFVGALEGLNQTLEHKVAERTRELEAAVTAQRRLLGDISHEIKSPLARLSMAVGLARRAVEPNVPRHFDRMESEVSAISALVGELLTLAKLDGTAMAAEIRLSPLDLSELIGEIVDDARYERPDRNIDLTLTQPDRPIMIRGDSALLRRGIENVVRNALFYTSVGVPVRVLVEPHGISDVKVLVADKGPGVPREALAHLFEPFYRVDVAPARQTGGTGIGLAICQRVIRRHGGSVTARLAEPQGLEIEIILPLDSVSPAATASMSGKPAPSNG